MEQVVASQAKEDGTLFGLMVVGLYATLMKREPNSDTRQTKQSAQSTVRQLLHLIASMVPPKDAPPEELAGWDAILWAIEKLCVECDIETSHTERLIKWLRHDPHHFAEVVEYMYAPGMSSVRA